MDNIYPKLLQKLPLYDGLFDAYKLEAKDCDVLFASYPSGTAIEPHKHETENFGVIIKGELVLTMEGETKKYSTGDWYHVPANMEHSAQFDVDTSEIEFWFTSK